MDPSIYRDLQEEVLSMSGDEKHYMGYHNPISYLGTHMDRGDLIQIIKELDYAIYSNVDPAMYNEIIHASMREIEPDDYMPEGEEE